MERFKPVPSEISTARAGSISFEITKSEPNARQSKPLSLDEIQNLRLFLEKKSIYI
jgi:hypothetical protein